ncbi:hypothetical protein [Streptomyces montanisoli]|uniref:Uncharacterized protein n=1 Tax=Streptomyces montanisoli TaxID=2798581 RepID=A0A940M6P3_9ACTN|nr:hypothetical protein [Streptomyces montanisoli]MBP0457184.1 hypothetical protein [Streptomyces montanisoli]
MLTPDMSDTGWWIFAVLAGLAMGVVIASLCQTWRKRLYALVVPPCVGLAYVLGRTLAVGESAHEASYMYTLAALSAAITGLIYMPWMRRQIALRREGKAMGVEAKATKYGWLFVGTFALVVVGVAFLVH